MAVEFSRDELWCFHGRVMVFFWCDLLAVCGSRDGARSREKKARQ